MKTQRGNLPVSAYTKQEFVLILTFNVCFINCRWHFSISVNIAYFRNSYGIDIFPDVCVKNIIHPPRLDNEQLMIISELNMLLLAKDEMYNIDGFTKSNIDTFIKLIATD